MSQIASKNIYELLGNDPELDPDRPADPPTKAIEKPVMRHGKREGDNAPKATPERQGNDSRAKQTDNTNENAFRDRGVGSDRNRGRGSGEQAGRGDGRGRGRGGRGGRGGGRGGPARADGDRHSRTGIAEHEKQAAHGWGGNDGDAELADEQAGEAIAHAEEKEAVKEDAEAENNPEPEPEDRSKSYADYLLEKAEKASLAAQNVRKANEGTSAKFPEGKAVTKDEEEDFMAGSGGKAKRERARKEKVRVELDGDRMLAPPPREGGSRGGRGDGRGRGEGRGEFRGRGRGGGEYRGGEGRGRGEGRGEFRGRGRGGEGRGRGETRGRGGRGGAQSGPNITDSSAFPSLGGA